MQEDKFSTVSFPEDEDIVYVLRFQRPSESEMSPFYVGESGRGTRRIGEYVSAQFAAATDFKVGVAVRALRNAGCKVFVSHQPSSNRRGDEAALISRYTKQGFRLLNAEPSYNYRSADRAAEQERIENFVAAILQSNPRGSAPCDA
ncbi:MAG: hypothetical protein NTY19_14865 [Planctomycetota bacterium]|nr:hypothetical protein [Planctomycetota bacterium]